ncbi:hypothetical protein Dimus_028729, partial [Dionaea muscipula]
CASNDVKWRPAKADRGFTFLEYSLIVAYLFCGRRKMTGIEYVLSEVMEPNLFVIRKQKRDSPEKVTPMLIYYALDSSIYQAPQLCNVFTSRIVGTLFLTLASCGFD